MALTRREVDRLLEVLGRTERAEIDCEGCLALVAEFAERNLAGVPIADGMVAIEQHLAVCDECREEYEALRRTLEDAAHDDDASEPS